MNLETNFSLGFIQSLNKSKLEINDCFPVNNFRGFSELQPFNIDLVNQYIESENQQ